MQNDLDYPSITENFKILKLVSGLVSVLMHVNENL